MSVKRRLAAAGMPAAGVTVLAALVLTGQPASAAPVDGLAPAARPGVAVLAAPVAGGDRGNAGYGDDDDSTPGDNGSDDGSAGGSDNGSDNGSGDDDNGSGDDGSDGGNGAGNGSDDGDADDDGRGNDGYGGVQPSSSPTPTPSASTPTGGPDNVPPGGVSPTTTSPGGGAGPDSVPGSGAGNGDMLPVTGTPMAAVSAVGGLLVAFGAVAVWYSGRRRRSA